MSVVMWRGELSEARRLTQVLRDHSARYSLPFWQFWARCFEVALASRSGEITNTDSVLRDPLCGPSHQESLATLDEQLATREALTRAEAGLAGWCAAELLRIQAEAILKTDDGNPARAEALLHRSIDLAHEQGALSWELRSATTLARLWHTQGRSLDAEALLAAVHGRFTEGFSTCDLERASALLEHIGPASFVRAEDAADILPVRHCSSANDASH